MITGFIVLLVCQFAGELVVRTLDIPIPGPVVGLVILFVVLQVRRPKPDTSTVRASELLLRHLQLLFVPAGVGIVAYLAVVRDNAVPVIGGLVVSWLVGLVVTAAVAAFFLRIRSRA